MGVVYRAEQQYPVRQAVAVKLLRAGGRPDRPMRMVAESRALARLDHPAIPKVLDAGTAPDGRPG
jgi:serine/threonine protein kinase